MEWGRGVEDKEWIEVEGARWNGVKRSRIVGGVNRWRMEWRGGGVEGGVEVKGIGEKRGGG